MQDIKYQPLKNNDDEIPVMQEYNFDPNQNSHHLQESRKYWLLKFLLICFLIVKSIYVINNFQSLINWIQNNNETFLNYNETDVVNKNSIKLYSIDINYQTTTTTATASSQNDSDIYLNTLSDIYDIYENISLTYDEDLVTINYDDSYKDYNKSITTPMLPLSSSSDANNMNEAIFPSITESNQPIKNLTNPENQNPLILNYKDFYQLQNKSYIFKATSNSDNSISLSTTEAYYKEYNQTDSDENNWETTIYDISYEGTERDSETTILNESIKSISTINNIRISTTTDPDSVYITTTTDATNSIVKSAKNSSKDEGTMGTNNSISNNYANDGLTTITIKTPKSAINLTLIETAQKITDPPTNNNKSTEAQQKQTMKSPEPLLPTPAYAKAKTTSSPSKEEKKQKYFINTSRCHIPYVDPFSVDIKKIFKPQHSTGCTKDQAIITKSFNDLDALYRLHINYTVAEGLRKTSKHKTNATIEEDVSCCYQEIIRTGSGSSVDTSFKLLPCANFHQNFVVPFHINGIIVKCKSKALKSTLQEDAFSFIQVNKTVIQPEPEPKSKNDPSKERRKPSILMIGIDTLSRINFRRNMPEMFKYLVDNKWYELLGYNKVGDNTLPNLMPLLSGYTRTTVYEKCKPKTTVGGLDNCNFIWTKFKNQGYFTAYAEDTTSMSTFNYRLKGFKKPPTDYYFRPTALAIEKSMKKKKKAGLSYCLGRRQFGEYIYDYGMEFVTRFKNQSSLGFFWTNSFSHNSYDVSATMDHVMLKYFKELESGGVFENSVVMFFSDHGTRWGPLLKLSEGFLEERLPMFFMSVPKWFEEEYPDLVKNLEINQKRLVNPFDINMTLQHLLKLAEPNYTMQQTYDCPKCQSVFEEMPENRTCDDASIPEVWCTCLPYKTESTKSELIKMLTHQVIQEMNHYYELKNMTALCSPLELKEITNAKKRYQEEIGGNPNNFTTYAIDFATSPITEPKTLFSATFDYDPQTKKIHLNVEDISRQSLYEKTAKCTDDKQAKKYCICKDSLKLPKTKKPDTKIKTKTKTIK